MTKCQDFLALHPLTDALDWWKVSRSNITTWKEFETAFLSSFLSKDYEDKLAEHVCTRVQGEKESVRDFAFTYRALCKRRKATLTENEIVKMILKHIKPSLARQLCSCVTQWKIWLNSDTSWKKIIKNSFCMKVMWALNNKPIHKNTCPTDLMRNPMFSVGDLMDQILQVIAQGMHIHLPSSLLVNISLMKSILTTQQSQRDDLPVTLWRPLKHPSPKQKLIRSKSIQDQMQL